MCDDFPELIIPESLEWINEYKEEAGLNYRIPSYKIPRIVAIAWDLETLSKEKEELKHEVSTLEEIHETSVRRIARLEKKLEVAVEALENVSKYKGVAGTYTKYANQALEKIKADK